jgi:hypothetical protein
LHILIEGGRHEAWNPSQYTKICSMHFDLADFTLYEKYTKLNKDAVPKIPKTAIKKVCTKSIMIVSIASDTYFFLGFKNIFISCVN